MGEMADYILEQADYPWDGLGADPFEDQEEAHENFEKQCRKHIAQPKKRKRKHNN